MVGLFVYTIVVAQMQHFSGWAAAAPALALQAPNVIRTTENMLKLVLRIACVKRPIAGDAEVEDDLGDHPGKPPSQGL